MAGETTTTSLADTVTAAYDLVANFALRPQLYFSMVATRKPTRQSHRGATVDFPFYGELAEAITPLNEVTDVTPVAMSDSLKQVTLVEYGNAVKTTAKVRGTDFLEVDAGAANLIGYNAGLSYDTLARNVLEDDTTAAASLVTFVGQATEAAITATDVLNAADVRTTVAKLRANSAMGIFGSNYWGILHPDVAIDLITEAGTANAFDTFGAAATAGDASVSRVWNNVIGTYLGVTWIESPRPSINVDGGSTTVDTYTTTILGQESLACAYSSNVSAPMPQIVQGPVTDNLRRHSTVGWYWLGGFAEFREETRGLIISASSIGAN